MGTIRRALGQERNRFALTAVLIAIAFILTDHRRDLIGFGATNGEVTGPVLVTTIARFVLMAFAIVLAMATGRRPSYGRSPAVIAVGTLMLYFCATTIWSADPVFTLRKLVVLTTVAVTAWCLSLVFDLERIADIVVVVLTSYLVLGIAVELISGKVLFIRVYRFEGTTGANQNGMYASVIGLIAGLRLLFGDRSRRAIVRNALLLLFASGITFVTMSRTAMIALAAAWVFVALLQAFSSQTSHMRKTGLVLTGIGVMAAVWFAVTTNHRSLYLGTFNFRTTLWEPLWDAIQQRPVQGYGYLGFWVSGSRNRVGNSHSVYIDLLLDGGVIALVLYLVAVGLVLLRLISVSRSRTDLGSLFGIGLLTFVLVHGIAESMFNRPTIANLFLLWVVLRAVQHEPISDVNLATDCEADSDTDRDTVHPPTADVLSGA